MRVLALCSLAAVGCAPPAAHAEPDLRVEELAREFFQSLSGEGYEHAREAALELCRIGRERDDDLLLARGLMRSAFVEIYFGTWEAGWEENLRRAEELCTSTATIAEAELRIFRGYMRGKYLQRLEDGLEDIQEAIWLANELREDPLQARALAFGSELHTFAKNRVRALEFAYRSLRIAELDEQRAPMSLALFRVMHALLLAEAPDSIVQPYAVRLRERGVKHHLIAAVAGSPKSLEEQEEDLRRSIERSYGEELTRVERKSVTSQLRLLAQCLESQGRYEEALDISEAALEDFEELGDPTSIREIRFEIANLKMEVGREDLDVRALEARVGNTPELYASQTLARAHRVLGNVREANAWQRRANENSDQTSIALAEQVARAATESWERELREREAEDALGVERRSLARLRTGLAVLSVCFVAGFVGWRYREKARALGVLQEEVWRRQVEEARSAELREQLIASQRLETIGTFSTGLAHDINNALMAIVGQAELAHLASDPEELSGCLRSIVDTTELARGTTRGLLTFARQDPSELKAIDLVALVRNAHTFLGRILPDSIALEFLLETRGEIFCECDENKLKQVLVNLVLNARDAITGAGKIELALKEGEPGARRALLQVRDNGAGMSEAVRGRIFDPFFTTKERSKGTGLGMAVVHGIVREHGGAIEIDSAEGFGTTVTVALPISVRPSVEEPRQLLRTQGHGRVALIAEDDSAVRAIVRRQLELEGFRVFEFDDAESLLESWRSAPSDADVLVLDNGLPGMDGEACLATIRREAPAMPAVLMSGLPFEKKPEPQTARISKPFGRDKLSHALRSVLSS